MRFNLKVIALLTSTLICGCESKKDLVTSSPATASAQRAPKFKAIENAKVKLDAAGQIIELDLRKSPDTWLEFASELSSLKQLNSLRLRSEAVNDDVIQHIANLNLTTLDVGGCKVTDAAMETIATLKKLKDLGLYNLPISDQGFAILTACTQLEKLNLRATKITDDALIQSLPNFKLLKSLEISETKIGDPAIPAIALLANLTDLNLWLTQTSDAGVEQLAVVKLQRLNLDNIPELTDRAAVAASKISTLQFLHMGKTSITDKGLSAIEKLPNLNKLHINNTNITLAAVEQFQARKPNVEVVF